MKRYLIMAVCLSFAAGAVYAATKEQKCLANCGVVMQEVLETHPPLQVPKGVMSQVFSPSALLFAWSALWVVDGSAAWGNIRGRRAQASREARCRTN